MNHIYLFLLLFDCFGQCFSFFFVFNSIIFVLLNALFIFSNGESMPVLKKLYLLDKRSQLLLQFGILPLQLFVPERSRLNIFVNHLFDLYYFLYNFLDLNWPLDVDRLNLDLTFDLSASFKILSETLYFIVEFCYEVFAFRMILFNFLKLLFSSLDLLVCIFFCFFEFCLEKLQLLVFRI